VRFHARHFFVVREKKTGIVIAEPQLLADLATNPISQLNLIAFARLALNPEPFPLPRVTLAVPHPER